MVSKAYCQKRAREIRDQLDIRPPPPVDIEKMATEWGVAVEYVVRPSGFHGQMVRNRAVIEISRGDHPHRQRFTLGHELGHYVLGHNPVYSRTDDRELSDPWRTNEREADIFAVEALMPEEWVRQDWKELQDARGMAALYNLSDETMWYRLEELRLIVI